MKILLIFDSDLTVDSSALETLFNKLTKSIKFKSCNSIFLETDIIRYPETFQSVLQMPNLQKKLKKYDRILFFTVKQYCDNFFFYTYKSLTIFSFYAWDQLTNLSINNGILYFIIDILALEIDNNYRHYEVTGCIYDFLKDKQGIDDGMRQAMFCPNCLKRLEGKIEKKYVVVFDDLKVLMNHLAKYSKWNRDIIDNTITTGFCIQSRKSKSKGKIQVVIASPGDTAVQREKLLSSLETKFRKDGHEDQCGFRLIVSGWEDLASQSGYVQDVINATIISKCDFVIALFKHKLGTPTKNIKKGVKRSESGTVEELINTLDTTNNNNPIGMAYFCTQPPLLSADSSESSKIFNEWNRVKKFQKSIEKKIIFKQFTDDDELIDIIIRDLAKNIKDYIIK